jgi:hypothetical protein
MTEPIHTEERDDNQPKGTVCCSGFSLSVEPPKREKHSCRPWRLMEAIPPVRYSGFSLSLFRSLFRL